MFTELQPNQFAIARPLLDPGRIPAQAVLTGRAPGRVFVNDADHPTAVFVWDEFRFCYLAGDSHDDRFAGDLARLLKTELYPAAQVSHDPTVVFDPDTPDWFAHLDWLVQGWPHVMAPRQMFTFDPASFALQNWEDQIPDGLCVQLITTELAKSVVQPVVGILWPSIDDFLAHGLGYCVMDGDTIASVCFSVTVANQHAETSIDTHPDYRQQGLATLCGAAFMTGCLARHVTPVWECWTNNEPSRRLAAKLGFQESAERVTCFVNLSPQTGG